MGEITRHIRSIANYSGGSGSGSGGFSRGSQQNSQDQRQSRPYESGLDAGGFGMPIQPPLQFHVRD